MQGLRLLQRLKEMEKDPERRDFDNVQETIGSVLSYLTRILNTKQGSVLIAKDFGMPDFTDLAGSFSSHSFEELSNSIQDVVQKFEPRLKDVRVQALPVEEDRFSLRFKVEGLLATHQSSQPVAFETVVDPDGRVQVKS